MPLRLLCTARPNTAIVAAGVKQEPAAEFEVPHSADKGDWHTCLKPEPEINEGSGSAVADGKANARGISGITIAPSRQRNKSQRSQKKAGVEREGFLHRSPCLNQNAAGSPRPRCTKLPRDQNVTSTVMTQAIASRPKGPKSKSLPPTTMSKMVLMQ